GERQEGVRADGADERRGKAGALGGSKGAEGDRQHARVSCAQESGDALQSGDDGQVAASGLSARRASTTTARIVALDPAEVGDRAEGVPRGGRRRGGRVAGYPNAADLVPAGRRRTRAASRVAPDAAGREPLAAGELHTETHTTGSRGAKGPQRHPLRRLVFEKSWRGDLN